MFILFIPQVTLRTLRLSEIYLFLSLAEAQGSQRTSLFILFLPKTPLRALRLCEIIFIFSRRGTEAAENFNV